MADSDKRTLGEQTYQRLLTGICDLTYPPGHKLSEAQIAKAFGVSRAPVRDAFARLERQGLVRIVPQVGTIVSANDRKQVADVCQMRLILEAFAARKAAEMIDDAQKQALYKRFAQLSQPQQPEAYHKAVASTDQYLHNLIYRLCANEELRQTVVRYAPVIERIRNANATWSNRRAASVTEMRQIASALLRSDPDAAEAAMRTHIGNIHTTIEQLLREKEEFPHAEI